MEKIKEILIKSELSINERWNKGDVDGALEVYADDVTYFDPMTEKTLVGKKEVEAYFRNFFEGKLNIHRNDFLNERVIVSENGDMAVITYNLNNFMLDEEGNEQPGAKWNSTQVYRLIDGVWKVVHVNWSFTQHPAVLASMLQ
jgi:uncharacterized protein (TIGR02246 family)